MSEGLPVVGEHSGHSGSQGAWLSIAVHQSKSPAVAQGALTSSVPGGMEPHAILWHVGDVLS